MPPKRKITPATSESSAPANKKVRWNSGKKSANGRAWKYKNNSTKNASNSETGGKSKTKDASTRKGKTQLDSNASSAVSWSVTSAGTSKTKGRAAPASMPATQFEEEEEVDQLDEDRQQESEEKTSTEEFQLFDEEEPKICLVAHSQHGRFGCAYFDSSSGTIYIYEDSQEGKHFDLTNTLLEQCNADVILTSSRSEESFIDVLHDFAQSTSSTFQIRPHKEFTPAKGRDRLLSLRILSHLRPHPNDLRSESSSTLSSDTGSGPGKNTYSILGRQHISGANGAGRRPGDPLEGGRNAAVRLGNFVLMDDAPLALCCVGALIDHLLREQAIGDLDDQGIEGLDVKDIRTLALNEYMQINSDALTSLQIFADESHASIHNDRTKEGLSLFGTLNTTLTPFGRSLLRTYLLRPSLSLPTIRARHDAVACFVDPRNSGVVGDMKGFLREGGRAMPRCLNVLVGGKGGGGREWEGIIKFVVNCALLRESLYELSGGAGVPIVQELFQVIDLEIFKEIGNAINETIDWDESQLTGRVCVRPRIDEELDNRKRVYAGIDGVLSKVAVQMSYKVPPDYARELNVVYFPQLGFLVCLPMTEEWERGEKRVLDGWTFQFSSEEHVYFKCQEMHDMDKHIGDLVSLIADREIEIIQSLLETAIIPHITLITSTCDVLATLDVLIAFADAAGTYGYVRPVMREAWEEGAGSVEIRGGRHPLQEQVVDVFVPNDAYIVSRQHCHDGPDCSLPPSFSPPWSSSLVSEKRGRRVSDGEGARDGEEEGKEKASVVILTGANACGKSVYLKQIALIQFMAQIGSFVPAESATLGIVDKIFTRVSTRESVSKVQSSFMIDLNQVSLAIRNSTPRSLILLDEFGKGTITEDGAALFCATINHFLSLGSSCPKVLVATHFHNVFKPGMIDPTSQGLAFRHMRILLTTEDGKELAKGLEGGGEEDVRMVRPSQKITYLYRVAPGLALTSHAAQCAEIYGVPKAVVDRAQYVSDLIASHEIGRLLEETMTDEEAKELEEAEEVFKRFLDWRLDDMDVVGETGEDVDVKDKLREILGMDVDAGEE